MPTNVARIDACLSSSCGCPFGASTLIGACPLMNIPKPAALLYFVQQYGGFFGQIGFLLYRVQHFDGNRSE
ncbi:MAG: hypothetical protein K0Q73_6664, partial [Paenibacillus sp.]|nr:hypothetical protein [Paenibacillus sp.]